VCVCYIYIYIIKRTLVTITEETEEAVPYVNITAFVRRKKKTIPPTQHLRLRDKWSTMAELQLPSVYASRAGGEQQRHSNANGYKTPEDICMHYERRFRLNPCSSEKSVSPVPRCMSCILLTVTFQWHCCQNQRDWVACRKDGMLTCRTKLLTLGKKTILCNNGHDKFCSA
jgi:hypothetical protein